MYLTVDTVSIPYGAGGRVAYENSASGRMAVQSDHPELWPIIYATWGDTPTVEDAPPEEITPSGPTQEERFAALEEATKALIAARLEG